MALRRRHLLLLGAGASVLPSAALCGLSWSSADAEWSLDFSDVNCTYSTAPTGPWQYHIVPCDEGHSMAPTCRPVHCNPDGSCSALDPPMPVADGVAVEFSLANAQPPADCLHNGTTCTRTCNVLAGPATTRTWTPCDMRTCGTTWNATAPNEAGVVIVFGNEPAPWYWEQPDGPLEPPKRIVGARRLKLRLLCDADASVPQLDPPAGGAEGPLDSLIFPTLRTAAACFDFAWRVAEDASAPCERVPPSTSFPSGGARRRNVTCEETRGRSTATHLASLCDTPRPAGAVDCAPGADDDGGHLGGWPLAFLVLGVLMLVGGVSAAAWVLVLQHRRIALRSHFLDLARSYSGSSERRSACYSGVPQAQQQPLANPARGERTEDGYFGL
jgi:hypothetical protein